MPRSSHVSSPSKTPAQRTSSQQPTTGSGSRRKSTIARPEDDRLAAKDVRPSPSRDAARPLISNDDPKHAPRSPKSRDDPLTPSQLRLSHYRECLTRDLERREISAKTSLLMPSLPASPPPPTRETDVHLPQRTLSTESGNTIRGDTATSDPSTGQFASTPSYPFPRMAPGSKQTPSPPVAADIWRSRGMHETARAHDRVLSGPSTPASNLSFYPNGVSPNPENPDFPSPNLYSLSLMLGSEPGLDGWWSNVVQIMTDVYKAQRVTLSVPADPTDVENVPWGQKATYNQHQQTSSKTDNADNLEAPNGTESTFAASPPRTNGSTAETSIRPNLVSRHTYTSYEESKSRNEPSASSIRRPAPLPRSKSYFTPGGPSDTVPDLGRTPPNAAVSEQPDVVGKPQALDWDTATDSPENEGRVLPALQALDHEMDPLIDHSGVRRVLERGKVIALTRSYPYPQEVEGEETLPNPTSQFFEAAKAADDDKPAKRPKKQVLDSVPRLSSIFGTPSMARGLSRAAVTPLSDPARPATTPSHRDEDDPLAHLAKYEEYEQAPPSPWSQSPAPSPAVRTDVKENPFFTDAVVDEDSFNPDSAAPDYSSMQPPAAIGIDNSWTVLHIPLTHAILPKLTPSFNMTSTIMEQKAQARGYNISESPARSSTPKDASLDSSWKLKPAPIAILSILSPVIPYPSNLRHSLEHLSPHLAMTFALCRHHSNLERELAGMRRKRPATTTGFGALKVDSRQIPEPSTPAGLGFLNHAHSASLNSLADSITSPSEYSALGSPSSTPAQEHGSLGSVLDKSVASPSQVTGDSYFASKMSIPRQERRKSSAPLTLQKSRDASMKAPDEIRPSLVSPSLPPVPQVSTNDLGLEPFTQEGGPDSIQRLNPANSKDEHAPERLTQHTMLHSYGADFASTFPSLPSSGTSYTQHSPTSRATISSVPSSAQPYGMPPPSDRLKGLILDSLSAHVFVALPQTGEIVWVNSRYLSYRDVSVEDLWADPWGSIHPDDRDGYLKAWKHSLRTGEQFLRTVRIRRFDGVYRWFYARAVGSRDKRGVLMQFLGSYMDIHDQHIAEVKAARQEEIEASEAKHRLLANLIPQIIFTATEDDGITFANEQWLSYTGQSFEDSLGLGFMDFVHPEDLARCRFPSPSALKDSPDLMSKESSHFHNPPGCAVHPEAWTANEAPRLSVDGGAVDTFSSGSMGLGLGSGILGGDFSDLERNCPYKVTTDSNGRLSYTTEVRLRAKTGEYRWHLIRCVEIDTMDFGSGANSYFGSATDINDHKLVEAKLKEAMDSKGRFLSNMSHEIRTPLIGISGMVSFLQDTTLDEEQRDFTNTIQTSATSLLMIINDILDLSKVAAGMMKIKREWFHARSLIEDVNELVSTMAIAKRLELNYIVEEDVPAWIKGDKIRIRQVLLNVIGNAIKFTSEGEVFSRCRVYKGDCPAVKENEVMLEFAIIDTGRGFTKEEADLIFKPFSQIDGSSTRQHGGSGLGLVISRQLVELHGGMMEGTAVPGKGSTFTFTAKFALPTADDYPDLSAEAGESAEDDENTTTLATATAANRPELEHRPRSSANPKPNAEADTPLVAPASRGSSGPPVPSLQPMTIDRLPTSSTTGPAGFSEAARASGQDLSQMALEMPNQKNTSPDAHAHQKSAVGFQPPLYSILIICPQAHSREATSQHIAMTIPKDVPYQITALGSAAEARKLIGGTESVTFTHIVLNLASEEEIVALMNLINKSMNLEGVIILVLTDSVQRQAVLKLSPELKDEKHLKGKRVTFIYKPVKPSRFAVIFDPEQVRDLSIDLNRSSAQRMVESQKASYLEMERRLKDRDYRVLLVEDNPVNQKVLTKFLKKVGVTVEVATDGEECTEKVFKRDGSHYAMILCDLHMPRKDGYQACREIREWETANRREAIPIIALSANVMSDVHEKCVAAGFSDYVAKPVDFIALSRTMSKFL